jgi:hypothetical protein
MRDRIKEQLRARKQKAGSGYVLPRRGEGCGERMEEKLY